MAANNSAAGNAASGDAKDGLDPAARKMWDGQFAMARLCEHRGDGAQAVQLYEALLKQTPKDARLNHRLAVLAVERGDFARAEELFATARSLAAPRRGTALRSGLLPLSPGQTARRRRLFRDSLQKEPNRATTINNLALVVGREGHYDESLALFQRVNTEAEAYANLAYVKAQNGDSTGAEQLYLRSLTLDDKLRAAAEAMLQVADRRQTQAKFASADQKEAPVAAPAPAGAVHAPSTNASFDTTQ